MATIDVSAQFGGRDAAQAVLPHFRALKSALKGKSFEGFPFPQLAFVLRVDGAVNAYGLSGSGNVEFDRRGQYVSVDIGITREDLAKGGRHEVSVFVAGAIMSSVELLKASGDRRLTSVNWRALETALQTLAAAYAEELGHA